MALYFNPFNEQYYSQTKSRIQDIYDTVTSNNTTSLTFKYIGCVMIVLTYYFRHSIYRTVSDFYITGRMTWVFFAALSIVSLLIIIFVLVFSSTI